MSLRQNCRTPMRSPDSGSVDCRFIRHRSFAVVHSVLMLLRAANCTLAGPLALLGPEPPIPGFSISYMDRAVSPRTNFYEFAVGQWLERNPVPPNEAVMNSAVEMNRVNAYRLHLLLEAAAASHARKGTVRRQVGDFYISGMDTNRLERLGLKPVETDLHRIESIASIDDFFRELARLHREDIRAMFDLRATPDFRKHSVYSLKLEQGGLSLPTCEYYVKPAFTAEREGFRTHMTKMFVLLGETPNAARSNAAIVLDLETALARASVTPIETHKSGTNYNKFMLAELLKTYPTIPWQTYLAGINLADIPWLIVGQPYFFRTLDGLLRERTLADWRVYLRWQVLHGSARYLCASAETENFDFFGKNLASIPEQRPRWRRALATVDAQLGDALGQLYIDRYFPLKTNKRVNELVEDLKAAFRTRLQRVDWMTEQTREKTLARFSRFTLDVGCPAESVDHSSLEIRADDYLGNVRRAAAGRKERELTLVGKIVDPTEWDLNAQSLNAEFARLQNGMHLPAAMLQPPFFDVTNDDAVNYGGIGTVIGHEMTHGYAFGLSESEDGTDWTWNEQQINEKSFNTNMQKIVDQYADLEALPGLRVDGMRTLGENLADIGGARIAFDALQLALTRDPSKRKKIDGFTPEQRFFISFAQLCRANVRETVVRRLAAEDRHAPAPLRAVAPLQNFQEFFDAFDIERGDPMWRPPELRAHIW
jgi:putative endopeptidase